MVSYRNDNGILEVRHRHEVIRIQAWGPDSVRVRAANGDISVGRAGAGVDAGLVVVVRQGGAAQAALASLPADHEGDEERRSPR